MSFPHVKAGLVDASLKLGVLLAFEVLSWRGLKVKQPVRT
jgi:hypothetical protein